jgi:hypothetical protein
MVHLLQYIHFLIQLTKIFNIFTYGYPSSVVNPFLLTKFKALYGIPPLHPKFKSIVVEQSINYCSDKEGKFPVVVKKNPSKTPVVLKVQHDPHFP